MRTNERRISVSKDFPLEPPDSALLHFKFEKYTQTLILFIPTSFITRKVLDIDLGILLTRLLKSS